MGNCIYCGQPAGFLRSRHKECEASHREKMRKIEICRQELIQVTTEYIQGKDDFSLLDNKLKDIVLSYDIERLDYPTYHVESFERTVDQIIEDGVVSDEKSDRLIAYMKFYNLSQNDVDIHGAATKLVKAAILNNTLAGIIQSPRTDTPLPINLQKNEQLVWIFKNVQYLEDKIRKQYIGGSQGMSFRVMKGVYYHVSAFKGRAVESSERVYVDSGLLFITSKHLYFWLFAKSYG